MSRLYAAFRRFSSRWIWLMLGLVTATIYFGMTGFASSMQDQNWMTDLYLVGLLFTLNCSEVAHNVPNWQLEIARWLGFLTSMSAVGAVLVRLFSERALQAFVSLLARDHVILAGLGNHGEELVRRLRKRGEDVIVLISGTTASQLDTCRDLGAVVMIGNPASDHLLERACLSRAKRLLVLFEDDLVTLQAITEAFRLLQPDKLLTGRPTSHFKCVARLTEPGLQDVILQHELHRRRSDFFTIDTINLYDLAARSMLARARWHSATGELTRMAILGLGEQSRLAETLILRVVRDTHAEGSPAPLIHVYDQRAAEFVQQLTARFPWLLNQSELLAFGCSSDRCGIGCDDPTQGIADAQFDAAFVCVEDESRATVQAVRLARLLKTAPVIVRTQDSRNGPGALLSMPGAGGLGANIIAVGFEDLLLDPTMVCHPKRELVAQACHEGYLSTIRRQIADAERNGETDRATELRSRPANVPWERLSPHDRDSNRALANAHRSHLQATHLVRKTKRYVIRERLVGHTGSAVEPVFYFSPDEIEFLAEREHQRWEQFKRKSGWTYGAVRNDDQKQHPSLVPFNELDEPTKELDREIFRQLPAILARADFVIRSVDAESDLRDDDR
jgi:hypothetical protein